jgi:hypothetical protein
MSIHRSSVAVVLAACVALTGCSAASGPAPQPSRSVAPIESPEPSIAPPEPAVLVIAGREVRVLDENGDQIDALPYTVEPAVATEFFSTLFEAPPVLTTQVTDENCTPNASIATWGDGLGVAYGEIFLPEGQRYMVSAKAGSVGGIAIHTPSGVGVGEPIERLHADIPVEQRAKPISFEGVTYDSANYDVAAGEWTPDNGTVTDVNPYWGAYARAEDGFVTRLQAPIYFVDSC